MAKSQKKDNNLIFTYDNKADVLYCHIGKPVGAICHEELDGVFIHKTPKVHRIVGFTIVDYRKRKQKGMIKEIPHFKNIEIPY